MAKFPLWKGFEFEVQGCLLEQIIDLSSPLGVAYERCIDFYKDFHTHDRLMFVFPRGSCLMDIRTKNPQGNHSLDSKNFLTLPAGLVHDDEGKSAIYDTMALYPTQELVLECTKTLEIKKEELSFINNHCKYFSKSPWLHQLLQQYFFERVIAKTPVKNLVFFEKQIVLEVLRIFFKKQSNSTLQKSLEEQPIIQRAIKFIETNLFEKLTLEMIAENAFTSASSLLREFKRELKKTPFAYIRERRLEEALILLKKDNHAVGEVAILVGYENFGAFSEAFKRRYHKTPSQFKWKN